jgi:hypothetical protein
MISRAAGADVNLNPKSFELPAAMPNRHRYDRKSVFV